MFALAEVFHFSSLLGIGQLSFLVEASKGNSSIVLQNINTPC